MASRRLVAAILLVALLGIVVASGPAAAQQSTEEATQAPPQESTPEATVAPETPPPATFEEYTVASGDTLARIARRFNVDVNVIQADNEISNPNLIFPGQVIRIRTAGVPEPTATPIPPTATPIPGPTTTYVVQRGDTLANIARRFNTTVEQLIALNNITDPNLVFAGVTLTVNGEGPEPSPTEPPTATPEPEVDVEATAVPVPNVDFDYGIAVFTIANNAPEVAAAARELGMHWVKYEVSWRDYEPVEGQIDFTTLDAALQELDVVGLKILLTITNAPDWARTTTTEAGPPDDYTKYANFVGALAQRYVGYIDGYEIWSEPNLRREWNSTVHAISPEEYIDLLRLAYAAIKQADPATTVVSAGLAPTGFNDGINAINDRLYLTALYHAGLADVSDAIGVHPNGWANPPDALCCEPAVGVETHFEDPSFYFMETLNDYRTIMVQNNDAETAIWVTDFGWGTSEDTEAPSGTFVFVSYTSLAEQAIYTPRAFEIGQELGYVGPMFLNNLDGCVVEPANAELCFSSLISPVGQPRPVYSAIQAIDKSGGAAEATESPLLPAPEQPTAAPTVEAPAAPTQEPPAVNTTPETAAG